MWRLVGGGGEVGDEDRGGFLHGEDGVFGDGGVGGEDAFGEAEDDCAGQGEVLLVGLKGGVRGVWGMEGEK